MSSGDWSSPQEGHSWLASEQEGERDKATQAEEASVQSSGQEEVACAGQCGRSIWPGGSGWDSVQGTSGAGPASSHFA